jgi:hypothetical protein
MREWVRHGRKGQPSGHQKKSQGSAETRNRMTYESGYTYGHPVRHAMQARQKAYNGGVKRCIIGFQFLYSSICYGVL